VLLYYITDRRQLSPNDDEAKELLLDCIRAAAKAGVDGIQLRELDLSTRELTELGKRALEIIRSADSATRLLINSRSDIAIACGADGAHLRSDDLSPAEARAAFMQAGFMRPVIGVSCHSVAEVELAEGHGADFAVFGPVFEKDGQAAKTGILALHQACHRQAAKPPMPVVALGGVSVGNAAECLRTGAAGVAGIRLFQTGNVAEVVSQLRNLLF
jgi:thiamine-phosphate pyrophosphorylase